MPFAVRMRQAVGEALHHRVATARALAGLADDLIEEGRPLVGDRLRHGWAARDLVYQDPDRLAGEQLRSQLNGAMANSLAEWNSESVAVIVSEPDRHRRAIREQRRRLRGSEAALEPDPIRRPRHSAFAAVHLRAESRSECLRAATVHH
jgi:hypothetical protein